MKKQKTMATTKRIKGKDLILFIGGKAVALSLSHKLSMKAEVEESSTKDDGRYKSSEVTSISWEVSTDALVGVEGSQENLKTVFSHFKRGERVDLVLGVPANIADEMPEGGWTVPTGANVRFVGKAIITSMDLDAPKDGNAKASIQLKGEGSIDLQTE